MVSLSRRTGSELISLDCPLPEQLLTRLIHAAEGGVIQIAQGLTLQERTSLALFCYGRAHFHDIGLTIAQTCDEHSLVQAAGVLGRVVYAQSRERAATVAQVPSRGRKKVSLAKPAAPPAPLVDIDEDSEPVAELIAEPVAALQDGTPA